MGCVQSSVKNTLCANSQHIKKKEDKAQKIKIVLCGKYAVGKTSITMRYCSSEFSETHCATLGGAYAEKKMEIKDEENLVLCIWDTSGHERYRSLIPLYYRESQVAILVFDVTDVESLKELDYWLQELDEKIKTEVILMDIKQVGNKCDVEQRQVSYQQGWNYAQFRGFNYIETSARSGYGIDNLFNEIVKQWKLLRQK